MNVHGQKRAESTSNRLRLVFPPRFHRTLPKVFSGYVHCANQELRRFYLLLSTPGGSVMNSLNILHVLIGLPFELITHNVGNVDSIGNAIFLAGWQ
jgi:hypothetical protein